MTTEVRTRSSVGTYEEICDAAVRATGLSDFGGSEHEEGLRLLVDDLNSPAAGLTGVGRYQMRLQVKGALVGRLLSQAGFAQHPLDTPVTAPVFVTGLPRTGTTALHRHLTLDRRHQGLELWLTEFPQPRPPRASWSSDPVFTALEAAYAAHSVADPEFAGLHHIDATAVEECWRLLRQSGMSLGFEALSVVPRYSSWLASADWTPAYRRHRANLQLIGLGDPRRWILKNPSHLAAIDALLTVYPDAHVVVTHRDPVTAVASACSLAAHATPGWSTTFTGATIGRTQLDWVLRSHRAYRAARERFPASHFIDVRHEDLVRDPAGTVRGVYEACDIEWTAETGALVSASAYETLAKASHRYSLSDFGLSAAEVREAFDE